MTQRVAVIGAGVVGLACASYLQMRGVSVTVIDPRPPGEYCSFGNAGCFSRSSFVPLAMPGMWKKVPGWLLDPKGPLSIQLGYLPRIAPWLWRFQRSSSLECVNQIADALYPLTNASIEKWRPLAARAGVPELVVQKGYALAYESPSAFLGDSLGRKMRIDRGVKIEVITGSAVREFEPALSQSVTHLVFMPEQGHCPNLLRLSQALADRLQIEGAQFIRHAAKGFECLDGRVARVVTDNGAVETDAVVIAAGAHSNELSAQLGSNVPLETERGYHVMLELPSVALRIPIMSAEGKFFATPMEGGLRIAGTVELAGLSAPPNYNRADVLLEGGKLLFPGLTHGKVERWMGHRPSLPDSKPVIGRSQRVPNVFFAFGHGHVGLTAAAPTGEIVADLITGRPPFMEIKAFSENRF
jgi:D-amino-acid dehydrogenase